MMGTDTDEEACRGLAAQGKTVVLKKGCAGCDVYTAEGVCHIPAFHIEEKDPTGCGDSFCAGFITGLVEGQCIRDAGTLANAAGRPPGHVCRPHGRRLIQGRSGRIHTESQSS